MPRLLDEHLDSPDVQFALFEYNLSMQLSPPDQPLAKYRRPIGETWVGSPYPPTDADQGEYDYNPFAFDVGCLGVLLQCQYAVSVVLIRPHHPR